MSFLTSLIVICFPNFKSVKADHLFEKLIVIEEIQPTIVIWTIIIHGLDKTGHMSMAVKLFSSMRCSVL